MSWTYVDTFIIILITSLDSTSAGSGVIAYNCSHEDVSSREFSLIQQRGCPDFLDQAAYSELVMNVQLLQRREFRDVHGYAAKIVRTLRAW